MPYIARVLKTSHIRVRLKRDGTCAETRFRLSPKRSSPFESAGASVQSTAGSRGVRISGSNAGYANLLGSVKRCEREWLPTPFASFPFISPPVRRRVPSRFNWTLPQPLVSSLWKLLSQYSFTYIHAM